MWEVIKMKKRNVFLALGLSFLLLGTNSAVHAEEVKTQTFYDNSGIANDIAKCNLDIKDYASMSDAQYNKYDVILIAESIDTDNSLLNYIYVYNAYRKSTEYLVNSFKYMLNNEYIYATGKLVDRTDTISKYKIVTNITYNDSQTTKRNYKFNSLTVNGADTDIDFKATISQNSNAIELEFNGYIFITGKDLLNITPIKNKVYQDSDIHSKDGSEYYDYKATGRYNKLAASLMFLNFDTNKDIDKINEIDLKYKVWRGRSDYDYLGNEYHNTVNYKYDELWADYSTKCRTISSDTIHQNYDYQNPGSIPFKYENSMSFNLKTTYVNKSDGSRTSAFPEMFDNLSNDKLKSGYTAKESFDKRQCSILIDALPVYIDGYFVVAYDNWYYWNFKIIDLEVMRINFTTDGITYNQKCNSGAPIDSETPGIITPAPGSPDKSIWEQLLDALKDLLVNHTLKFFLLIISIIALFIVLFKYGIKAIFSLAVKVITWPFKLLKSLFMRG